MRGGEAGYNLVVLVVAVSVLNILVAAMLPMWSTAIRREKEEELVFRGFQYAEAIRVYHNRFQTYPMKLDDLIKVKPRCIRQLWKDPMTEDGKWGLIFDPSQTASSPPPGEGPNRDRRDPGADDQDGRTPREGDTVQVGPIVGVRSMSGEKSMLVLFEKERYDEWHFTANLIPVGHHPNLGVAPESGIQLQFSTRWLGRPTRYFNKPPEGKLPDDQQKKKDPRRR